MLGRIMLAAALASSTTAPAVRADTPSWYPPDCLAIDYCAAVDSIVWVGPTDRGTVQAIVASAHGRAIVPNHYPVRESGDDRIHVCLRYGPFGNLEVTRLLVPAHMFQQ